MRQLENVPLVPIDPEEVTDSGGFGEQIKLLTGIMRRRYRIVLAIFLLTLPFGVAFYLLSPKVYTASATMLMETQKAFLPEALGGNTPRDATWMESQIGVLRSQNVAGYVVKQLRLADDPRFVRGEANAFTKLMQLVGLGEPDPKTEAERVAAATAAVMGGLTVTRAGASYMIRIDYRGSNAEQAVKIANAMVDGYIFDQLNAKYNANRRAGDWLQERLVALREQTAAAERAVVEFKAKNNIVTAGGSLMNDKQLTEMSARLATTRGRTVDLETRLNRMVSVRNAFQEDRPDAAVVEETTSEAMGNPIISRLRNQYLDLINREADWSVRYGKNHNAVVNVRNQIRETRRSIRDELGRIEESIKSEYEISKKQQDDAEKSLASLVSQSTNTNQAQIALFSLEAVSQSYRKIYDSFLERHTESVQQQSLPITDARLVSSATIVKSGPQAWSIFLTTLLAGGVLGAGAGAFRELMDSGFRTRDQVRSILQMECLAIMPLLPKSGYRMFRSANQRLPVVDPHARRTARKILPNPRIWENVVDAPSSPAAEAVRSLKLGLDLKSGATSSQRIVGVISSLPAEGKSTVALAMAASIAQKGGRVLLVDGDLRNPSLTRTLASEAESGILEVVHGDYALADVVWQDPVTGLEFLPAVTSLLQPARSDIFGSSTADSFFKMLQIKYDFVIVDLPPLMAGIEVRATLRHIDTHVMVIEWGVTKVDEVQYALRHSPGVLDNIAGVVLNKVDMTKMPLYDKQGGHYYYGRPRDAVH